MRRANLNLDRSLNIPPNADYEDYCFDAQQAAEKAIKAVFIHRAVPFPYTHNLGQLLKGLAIAGVRVPKYLLPANRLTRYAAETRYPGTFKPVTKVQYQCGPDGPPSSRLGRAADQVAMLSRHGARRSHHDRLSAIRRWSSLLPQCSHGFAENCRSAKTFLDGSRGLVDHYCGSNESDDGSRCNRG